MFTFLVLSALVSTQWTIVSGQKEATQFQGSNQVAWHGQFPYVVGLQYDSSEDRFAGALINENFVLTTAERILRNQKLNVYLGAHYFDRLDEPGRVNLVVDIDRDVQIFPEYHKNLPPLDNLALIKLPEAVSFSDFIRPIALPTKEDDTRLSFDGEVVYVTGWGTHRPLYAPSTALHFINVTVFPHDLCERTAPIEYPQLCLDSSTGRTLCKGDEGAPISLLRNGQPLLIGLLNIPERCVSDRPQIALRISSFSEWIEDTMLDWNKLKTVT